MIAADLRKRRPKPHWVWHLDEVYLKIGGRMVYLWRAVDAEGEVLDVLVQSKRNRHAALKLMKYAFAPERLVTDEGARTPRSGDRRWPRRHHLRLRVDHRIRRMDQRSRPWSAVQGEISIDGIEKYGSGLIRGIGPVYAKKMVKAFGDKVFDVTEAEPDRLREVMGSRLLRANSGRSLAAW
jgi:hypothetical protein